MPSCFMRNTSDGCQVCSFVYSEWIVKNAAAQLMDSSMPEKPILVTVGATNHPFNQQMHHQITITTPATTTESKLGSRRNSFKRSSWTIDPRRMLLFFATM